MLRFKVRNNTGVELKLPSLYIDYNSIGMISAVLTLIWAFILAPSGLSVYELTLLGLEKYFLVVISIIVYKKITYRMSYPFKVTINNDGIKIYFKTGKVVSVDTEEFYIDKNISNKDKETPFVADSIVRLVAPVNGGWVYVTMGEEEVSKLTKEQDSVEQDSVEEE